MKPVGLGAKWKERLEMALFPTELTADLTKAIEALLTTYRDLPERIPAASKKQWRAQNMEKLGAARRLLKLLDSSWEDLSEAIDRGEDRSVLQEQLSARIAQWETQSLPARDSRPVDWPRRMLLYHAMEALDAAGVPSSCHREGPRVLALRVVSRMADVIDNRRPTAGSLRLIKDVYKHYRQRNDWSPRDVRRLRYERMWRN